MPPGRPRKYHTPEQIAEAKRKKADRYYYKNREKINQKRRDDYWDNSDGPDDESSGLSERSTALRLAQAGDIVKELILYTRTSVNTVYYTRLYHDYLRLYAEGGKEAAVEMLLTNEIKLEGMRSKLDGDLGWIINDCGYGKEAKEMERLLELVDKPLNGVRELWGAAVSTETTKEFITQVAQGPLRIDV